MTAPVRRSLTEAETHVQEARTAFDKGDYLEASTLLMKTMAILNEQKLRLPTSLPVGATVRLPQHNWPSLAIFGILVLLLAIVGTGWIMQGAVSGKNVKSAK